jgi:hypothetical protein
MLEIGKRLVIYLVARITIRDRKSFSSRFDITSSHLLSTHLFSNSIARRTHRLFAVGVPLVTKKGGQSI